MASVPGGVIDPTKNAKYPVILSDALRGRSATEIFTGIRYNYQPTLSSENAPKNASLRQSSSSSEAYDLSFEDGGKDNKYAYSGTRATDAKQYVLYFDEARKAFILDRVDSVFSMNVTRTPENNDAESLRRQFEQLDTSTPAVTGESSKEREREGKSAVKEREKETPAKGKATAKTTAAARKKAEKATPAKVTKKEKEPTKQATRKQPEKKAPKKAVELLLPDPVPSPALPSTQSSKAGGAATSTAASSQKSATSASRKKNSDSDSDSDDDDGGLLVEYPDMDESQNVNTYPNNGFSPAFPTRRWSEFVNQSEEADDADGEADDDFGDGFGGRHGGNGREDEDVNELQLPSPIGARAGYQDSGGQADYGNDDDGGMDLEDDLEAELEAELAGEESEVSEED